jgi:hypothetical protein
MSNRDLALAALLSLQRLDPVKQPLCLYADSISDQLQLFDKALVQKQAVNLSIVA